MQQSHKWAAIINPEAGSGRCGSKWPVYAERLKAEGIDFTEIYTVRKFQAIELASKAVEDGFRHIIAVGGDGTIHEVLTGIISQSSVPSSEVALAVVPLGSGNDWVKLYDLPTDPAGVAKVIAGCNIRLQDSAVIKTTKNGQPFIRNMVNIGGVGFDAQVCREFDLLKEKGRSGKKLYVIGILKAFKNSRTNNYRIFADGELIHEGPTFSTAFGIGRFSGGGMLQTPDAKPDDGLISLTIIRKVSLLKVLFSLKHLFDGKIYRISQVSHWEVKSFEIYPEMEMPCEVDGENMGITPLKAEIKPLAIRVVVK